MKSYSVIEIKIMALCDIQDSDNLKVKKVKGPKWK